MPGAKHRYWYKPILFLLATRVLNVSPVGEGLRTTTLERSPLTSAMPRAKATASPRLHVETIYGHTQRTDLKWQKKVIYRLVTDAQTSRMDTNVKDSPHLKHDDIQCKPQVTNTSRTEFSL